MEQSPTLAELEQWFLEHCDGHWENYYGITITGAENAGWRFLVDLDSTELEGEKFEKKELKRNDQDWLRCSVDGTLFSAEGGPKNLQEMITTFLAWAKHQPPGQQRDELLAKFQDWYSSTPSRPTPPGQGLLVKTLDNPGWVLSVGLEDIPLAAKEIPHREETRNEGDWIDIGTEGNKFVAVGGPGNLEEILRSFISIAGK